MPLLLSAWLTLAAAADPLDVLEEELPSTAELPAEITATSLSPPVAPPRLGLSDRGAAVGDGGTAAPTMPQELTTSQSARSGWRPQQPSPCGRPRYNSAPIILGALDPCVLEEKMKRRMPNIHQCYTQALATDPSLRGKITLKITIDPRGGVTSATVRSSTMKNAALEACVVGVVSRTVFPPIEGGGLAIVLYPFFFLSG